MPNAKRDQEDQLTQAEVENQDATPLPDREAMSLISTNPLDADGDVLAVDQSSPPPDSW